MRGTLKIGQERRTLLIDHELMKGSELRSLARAYLVRWGDTRLAFAEECRQVAEGRTPANARELARTCCRTDYGDGVS